MSSDFADNSADFVPMRLYVCHMTFEEANKNLIASLVKLYDKREASSISALVMERLTGMSRSQRLVHKTDSLNDQQWNLFQQWLGELLKNRPVQYVLGETWFGPYKFFVDENVLIPRPETEELVDWFLSTSDRQFSALNPKPSTVNSQPSTINLRSSTILDIGTGSGCIPVYIKKKRPFFDVMALDISEAALNIAKKNSAANEVEIRFFQCDILHSEEWAIIPDLDIIISNPPYVPEYEKKSLEKHVRDFEPDLALFVPDNEPLVFYKAICAFALLKLNPGGTVFLESHRDFAQEVAAWYQKNGFSVEIRKDFAGNNRMIKAGRY